MVRKSLLVVMGLLVVLSFSSMALAQEYWSWNQFNSQYERFKYEIKSYSTYYDYEVEDEVLVEKRQIQSVELRKKDDETTEVTMSITYDLPTAKLGDELSMMGLGLAWASGGGEWIGEFMMLGWFASDLELEVGSSMQVFDGSRIRVIEKQKVAGVEGYLCRKTVRGEDDAGNRVDTLVSEWVIAPNVGWPLAVRLFQNEQVKYSMELVEYDRK
jgi:hypothetical protein